MSDAHSSSNPFVIAVAGGTGSGKTTIAQKIVQAINPKKVVYIPHDDYYNDQAHLSQEERAKTNYDHPHAFETSLLVKHLEMLRKGQQIEKPIYDFKEHTRSSKTEKVGPADLILVEGILIFEPKELREMFDLKIFVDTDADIRFIRRLVRDMKERNRTFDFIIQQYMDTVRPMHNEFVEPSKRYADIIIPEGGENKQALQLLYARIREIVKE